MTAFETTFHVGPDGKVHISVPPEFANRDVHITVEPAAPSNGNRPSDEAREKRRRALDRVIGTIDDPTFERPPQGEWEEREPLD